MLVKKIELRNFRQFKDKVVIDFSTDPDRNITIIIANNGSGKSTLSNAFLWCLYGETSFAHNKLLNAVVEQSMLLGDREKVNVSLHINQNNQDYIITRQQVYEKTVRSVRVIDSAFSVAIIKNGNKEFLNLVAANHIIKKILPRELSKFFFIGGERIETMNQEIQSGKSAAFSDAVRGLAGLTALMNLLNHYYFSSSKNCVIGQFNTQIDENGEKALSAHTIEIQRLQKGSLDRNSRIEKIEPQIEGYASKIANNMHELQSLLPAEKLKNEADRIDREIINLKEDKKKAINNFLQFFSSHTVDALSRCLIKVALTDLKSIGNLDKGIPHMRDTTVKFLIERGFCICGTKLAVGSDEYMKVLSLLEVLPPKSIGQMISDFSITAKNRVRNSDHYFDTFENSYSRIRQISDSIESKELAKGEIFDQITDISKAPYLRSSIESDKKEKKLLEDEKTQLIAQNINDSQRQKYIEAEREKLINISNNNIKFVEYREYAQLIYNEYYEEYKNKEVKVKSELQERVNNLLESIFDPYIKIELDEKYNIKVNIIDSAVNDIEILKDLERSTAQAYSVIFAFISGLISMAKAKSIESIKKIAAVNVNIEEVDDEYSESYPLVMDAPLSVFDKERIKNICNILPQTADQLIFFIKDTDGDIAEAHLGHRVGVKWKMTPHSKTITTVERRN